MTIYNMYDEVATLMAGLDIDKLMSLKATPAMQQRFEQLANQAKQAQISSKDKDELDHYIVLERLIRLAKLRATA
ncbi:hypothetical protein [Fibrella aquatilis]|uniref:Uncharacterized protein n=1 Tax=Fibrella aquatilis TaxID=2817059 RepID=A0A939G4V3_9BACT|nr:hypothetical protein [Fibrella aquatilis]MBO0930659.1 hypothetical protein [Fibrella aquatilis]